MSTHDPRPVGEHIDWGSRPDKSKRVYYDLVRARANAKLYVTVLSPHMTCVDQHWDGSNAVPCVRKKTRCRLCEDGKDYRWYAYLAVMSQTTGRKLLLQLTKRAVEDCPALDQEDGRLRGRELIVTRRHGERNAPVVVQMSKHCRPEPLPEDFDVPEALLAIWFVRKRGTPPADPRA